MNRRFAVAIDGPSGSGKTTAAKKTAGALGMVYVDTGAMYRAIALYNIRRGTDPADRLAVERALEDIQMEIIPGDSGQRLLLGGEDVTEALRTQEIAEGSSVVASYPKVREKMTELQRSIAENGRVVMDGRDIGSQVLPWAQVKIYMDASLETRVARRVSELHEKNQPSDPDVVRREVEIRDERDLHRAVSPLTRAADAVYLDTSDMDAEQTAARIVELVKAKGA